MSCEIDYIFVLSNDEQKCNKMKNDKEVTIFKLQTSLYFI